LESAPIGTRTSAPAVSISIILSDGGLSFAAAAAVEPLRKEPLCPAIAIGTNMGTSGAAFSAP
jgi:hypothetical protein